MSTVSDATERGPSEEPERTRSAAETVGASVANLSSIGLPELVERASLQTRTDRKYFVPAPAFRSFVELMSEELVALEIDGLRVFDYESIYFDCPRLSTYRAHLQRRRRRFKIRTRTYLDSGECMFEVKLEGRRAATVKHRVPYQLDLRGGLTDDAAEYVREILRTAYDFDPPIELRPVMATHYRRATLACTREPARLTCDVGLVCRIPDDGLGPGPTAAAPGAADCLRVRGDHVLVESKSANGSVADRMLAELGVRPVSVSKYCIGIAGLHPEVPSNPWHSTLRRYFDWQPALVA